jgi:hypothetical protein
MAFVPEVEDMRLRLCRICHKPIRPELKDALFGQWHKRCLKVSKEERRFIEYETPSGGHIRMRR